MDAISYFTERIEGLEGEIEGLRVKLDEETPANYGTRTPSVEGVHLTAADAIGPRRKALYLSPRSPAPTATCITSTPIDNSSSRSCRGPRLPTRRTPRTS